MAKLSTYTTLTPGQPVPLTKTPVLWFGHTGKTARSATHASGVATSIGHAAHLLRRGTGFVSIELWD